MHCSVIRIHDRRINGGIFKRLIFYERQLDCDTKETKPGNYNHSGLCIRSHVDFLRVVSRCIV